MSNEEIKAQIKSQLQLDKIKIIILSVINILIFMLFIFCIIDGINISWLYLISQGILAIMLVPKILSFKKHMEYFDNEEFSMQEELIVRKYMKDNRFYVVTKESKQKIRVKYKQFDAVEKDQVVKTIYFDGERKIFLMIPPQKE